MSAGDLGSDVGTASLNATAKMAELFLKLLEKLWDSTIGKSASEKAAAIRLKEAQQEKADKKFAGKLDRRSGEVSLRALRSPSYQLHPAAAGGSWSPPGSAR